jgi:alkylhydroperoxidase/carboxymuconolactone decarboxylase family protein YurZ
MSTKPEPRAEGLPPTFQEFIATFPEVAEAHASMAAEVDRLGPIDRRTAALIKIGICLGAGLESALRSHVRRALVEGATVEEIDQSILMGMTTCGFPRTVAAWQWAHEVIAGKHPSRP